MNAGVRSLRHIYIHMTPVSEPKQCKNNCNPGAGKPEEGSWRRNPGGGIPEEGSWGNSWGRDSWRRNPGGGILEESSWRKHPPGTLEEELVEVEFLEEEVESWQKNPGGRDMEEESASWRSPPPGPGPWHLEDSWSTGEVGILDVDFLPKKHPGGMQETTSGLPGGSQEASKEPQKVPGRHPGTKRHPEAQRLLGLSMCQNHCISLS
jgi:hypothetical protein